jgi:cholesterol transport system auxiliary component
LILSGCTLPRPASTPVVYDFGPGATQTLPSTRIANLPPLEVGTPQTSAALNSPAVLYRLGYADAQQLKPYTLARWSMPPAQLIGQRLREHLGLRRAIVSPGEIIPASPARQTASAAAAPAVKPETLLNLRLELEEFSQLFETLNKSSGLLRVRATLTQRSTAGETLLAQRSFVAQPAASTPDASGGVRALTAATDQVIGEIEVWLEQVGPATRAP